MNKLAINDPIQMQRTARTGTNDNQCMETVSVKAVNAQQKH